MISKTKADRHKRFLEAGFFPSEMPPPFVSSDLAKHRAGVETALETLPKVNGEKWYYRYVTTPEVILFPRPQRFSRQFAILNPILYFYLSREIANNWVELNKHLKRSGCSTSNLVFDWDGERTFLRPNYAARERRIRELSLEHPYLLHSDVARYYHSIYTHTIPWALHTKEFAKANRSLKHLGNRLDTLVRNGQDGQTIGLPVGPESSRVLAEILGVTIDQRICRGNKRLKKSFVRFVDDLTIGAHHADEAERIRNAIRKVLHYFQLDINEDKTETIRVLSLEYGSWRHELSARMPKKGGSIARLEIFFDLIHRLSHAWPRANVPVYALKQARTTFVAAMNWQPVEDFLLILYRSYPATLPAIVEILANRNLEKSDVDTAKIETFIKSNLKFLADNNRLGELAWMLFLAKVLRIAIKTIDVKQLVETHSSVCALLLCDLEDKGYLQGKLDKTYWNKFLSPAGLASEMWLYVYEASLKGWTGSSSSFVSSEAKFSELFKRQVSFYNDHRNFLRVNVKLELERRNRNKEKLAFAQGLDEAFLELLSETDDSSFGYEQMTQNDFYPP